MAQFQQRSLIARYRARLARAIVRPGVLPIADRQPPPLTPMRVPEAARIRTEQIDAAARLAPFSALASASVVPIIVLFAWGQGNRIYLTCMAVAIELIVIAILLQCHLWQRRSSDAPASQQHLRMAVASALCLGLCWGTMPVALFQGPGRDIQMLVACSVTGLLCTGIVIAPLPRAAQAFTGFIIVGSFIALARTQNPFFLLIALLLVIYTLFINVCIVYLARQFVEKLRNRLRVEDQEEIIRLLLRDFEENASDWLWEVDAAGRLAHVSARMAQAVGRPEAVLQGSFLVDLLRTPESHSTGKERARQQLAAALRRREPFHDLVLRVRVGEERKLWSLTGKPIFDRSGAFAGFRGVGSDVTAAKQTEARIAYLAAHDSLTTLPNRAQFQEQLRHAARAWKPGDPPLIILCLDLDNFKVVNDTHGHPVGDDLLRLVGRRLRATLRDGDRVARIGGDEFVTLLTGATQQDAARLSERIIAVLSEPYDVDGLQVEIGVSIGIAYAAERDCDSDWLLRNGDLALYHAKQSGRSTYCFYNGDMAVRARARRSLQSDLRRAFAHDELALRFQPIRETQSLKLTGFECLLRWNHPEHGTVMPTQFVPIAEEAGLIADIGLWVFRNACAEAVRWPAHIRFAINLSPLQFRDTRLAESLLQILSDHDIDPRRLDLEITEAAFLEVGGASVEMLRGLREAGVRIALDDFGTGYSSFSYLTRYSIDKIKIDKSFIGKLGTQQISTEITRAIIRLAGRLGMVTTAEGVETDDQLAELRELGCTEVQGFLLGRPALAEDARTIIAQGCVGEAVALAANACP